MINLPNYLRVYRRKTPLTQSDIAFLLNLQDYSNISRYENGKRVPSIDLLIMYHFLFRVPIEKFFEEKSLSLTSNLKERIKDLIAKLESDPGIPNNLERVKYLQNVLINLTS